MITILLRKWCHCHNKKHFVKLAPYDGGIRAGMDILWSNYVTSMSPYVQLDGCIVWNAHNTVLGSKRLAISATVWVGLSKDNKWSK